jgi:hypothetical protein
MEKFLGKSIGLSKLLALTLSVATASSCSSLPNASVRHRDGELPKLKFVAESVMAPETSLKLGSGGLILKFKFEKGATSDEYSRQIKMFLDSWSYPKTNY